MPTSRNASVRRRVMLFTSIAAWYLLHFRRLTQIKWYFFAQRLFYFIPTHRWVSFFFLLQEDMITNNTLIKCDFALIFLSDTGWHAWANPQTLLRLSGATFGISRDDINILLTVINCDERTGLDNTHLMRASTVLNWWHCFCSKFSVYSFEYLHNFGKL